MTPDPDPGGLLVDDEGLARCPWPGRDPLYLSYHDQEWGQPVHGERALFERLTLEAFQSGLSWITILRKREAFRRAFADYDALVVSQYADEDRQRLLTDPGIVRNRAKIDAVIRNAAAVLRVRETVDGGLDALIWSFTPQSPARVPRVIHEVPAITAESTALAKELKRHGFSFVGPTTAYAMMQACGLVNDHLQGCLARDRR